MAAKVVIGQKVVIGLLVVVVGLLALIAWALLRPGPPTAEERERVEEQLGLDAERRCQIEFGTFPLDAVDEPGWLPCVGRETEDLVRQWEDDGYPDLSEFEPD